MKRGWAIVAGIASVGALWGAWGLWRSQLGGLSLAEEWAAAKREGVPVEARDLKVPHIPESQNATRPYLTALAAGDSVITRTAWKTNVWALIRSAPDSTVATLSARERKRLRSMIAPLHPAFAPLREAALRGRLPLPRRAAKSYRDLRLLMDLVYALTVRAELRSAEGNPSGAFDDLEDAARASALLASGRSISDEGFFRSRMEQWVMEAMGRIVARHPTTKGQGGRIRRVVAALGPSPSPRYLLASGVLEGRDAMTFFANGGDGCIEGVPLLKFRTVREANEALLISYWRVIYARLPYDPHDFEGVRRAFQAAEARFDEAPPLARVGLLRPLGGVVDFLAGIEARRRVARSTADVLDAWQQTGTLPSSLPGQPGDPFGGRLRYRRDAKGIVVYSVNRNRKDDGGVGWTSGSPADDIGWRIPLATIQAVGR